MKDWKHNLPPAEAQLMLRSASLSDELRRPNRGLNVGHDAHHTSKAIARVQRIWPEYFRKEK